MSLSIIRKCMIFASTGTRSYGRWVHRKPTRVSFPFESAELKEEKIIELDEELLTKKHGKNIASNESLKVSRIDKPYQIDKSVQSISTKEVVGKDELNSKEVKHVVFQENVRKLHKKIPKLVASAKEENKVFDESGDVIYTKLQNDHTLVSTILTNAKSKKLRSKSGQIIVEGWRVIAEGLSAGYKMDALFFSRKDDLMKLRPFLPPSGPKVYKIPYKDIQLWSYVETTPGIMGVFKIKNLTHVSKSTKDKCLPLNIICDNIRDPGNLGSILRIAAAVGSQKLLLTKGCVDLWDPKVIRTASGAHFHLNIEAKLDWYDCNNLLDKNTLFCIADNKMKMPIIKAKVLQTKLREDLSFQARKNFRDSLEDQENADNSNDSVQKREDLIHIPITSYFDIDFTSTGNVTLVVGGETEGLSEDCFIYADMLKGVRLNIPMQSGLESINAGSAMAVIAFEIRKQFLSKIYNKDLSAASMYS